MNDMLFMAKTDIQDLYLFTFAIITLLTESLPCNMAWDLKEFRRLRPKPFNPQLLCLQLSAGAESGYVSNFLCLALVQKQ